LIYFPLSISSSSIHLSAPLRFVLHDENTMQVHIFQRISSIYICQHNYSYIVYLCSRKHLKCSFPFPAFRGRTAFEKLYIFEQVEDDIFYCISYFSIIFRIICTLKNNNLDRSSIFQIPTGQSTVATKTHELFANSMVYYFVEASCTHVF
jgi:hypothetical protein